MEWQLLNWKGGLSEFRRRRNNWNKVKWTSDKGSIFQSLKGIRRLSMDVIQVQLRKWQERDAQKQWTLTWLISEDKETQTEYCQCLIKYSLYEKTREQITVSRRLIVSQRPESNKLSKLAMELVLVYFQHRVGEVCLQEQFVSGFIYRPVF